MGALRKLLIFLICAVGIGAGVRLTFADDGHAPRPATSQQPSYQHASASEEKATRPSPKSQPMQQWIDRNVKPGVPVRLERRNSAIAISGPLRIPASAHLTIAADLTGSGAAKLVLTGDAVIVFDGATVVNVPLVIKRGRVTIRGLQYRGRNAVAAISISGPGPYRDLLIEDIKITDANFGVLRQGSVRDGNGTPMIGGIIRNARFARLHGDAIEWNVVPRDRGLLIEDITIDGIDDPNGRPNWGIGIGVAGRYDAEWADGRTATDFVIRNVKGRSLRQLVHVEGAKGFRVENITAIDISDRYSAGSNMHSAAFACYGCRDFTVSNLTADSGGMKIMAGVRKGIYVNPSRDFTLTNIHLARGGIDAEVGGTGSYGVLQSVRLDAGTVNMKGALQRFDLSNVRVTSADRNTEPLIEQPNWLAGRLFGFSPPARGGKRQGVALQRGAQ